MGAGLLLAAALGLAMLIAGILRQQCYSPADRSQGQVLALAGALILIVDLFVFLIWLTIE